MYLHGEVLVCIENATRLDLKDTKSQGIVLFTNYRFVYQDEKNSYACGLDVPLKSISKLIQEKEKQSIYIYCKDYREFVFQFTDSNKFIQKLFVEKLQQYVFPNRLSDLFAFSHSKPEFRWSFSLEQEYQRCCLLSSSSSSSLRVVQNKDYKLSPTYPSLLVVHAGIQESDLFTIAQFRSRARLPVVVWVHPLTNALLVRCSQPNRGLLLRRCQEDEMLVGWYRQTADHKESIAIADARSPMAAWGNHLKGKGAESAENYEGEIKNMDIDNIHAVRTSMESLALLTTTNSLTYNDEQFLTQVAATNWLFYLKRLLEGSVWIAEKLEKEKTSVVVHCSDGWDRASQLTSLSQLLLDPFYRSMQGFAILVEKEWVHFGHKFAERVGHKIDKNSSSSGGSENERSPVFIQFLDAVWQLSNQFPNAFEFNESFLLCLCEHVSSCRFGTFLCDSAKERAAAEIQENTSSVWGYLFHYRSCFENKNYVSVAGRLTPSCRAKHLHLWEGFFLRRDTSSPRFQASDFEALPPQQTVSSSSSYTSSSSLSSPSSASLSSSSASSSSFVDSSSIFDGFKQVIGVFKKPRSFFGSFSSSTESSKNGSGSPKNVINNNDKFFGVSLQKSLQQSRSEIPLPVSEMIKYIEENNGLETEGLFRVAGNKDAVANIVEMWKKGEVNPAVSEIEAATDILKRFFRDIPECVIPTDTHYKGFLAIAKDDKTSKEEKKALYQKLVLTLPPENVIVLRYLMKFLSRVASHVDQNKMNAKTLAICWSQNLLKCESESMDEIKNSHELKTQIVEMLIENESEIFPHSVSSTTRKTPDRVVHISLVGERGIGKQSLINCFSEMEKDGVTLGNALVSIEWSKEGGAALLQADVIMVCFKLSYYPSFFHSLARAQEIRGLKKPTLLVGLQSDVTGKSLNLEIRECAQQLAASSYRICSSLTGQGVASAVHEATRLALQKEPLPVAVRLARMFPSEKKSGVGVPAPGSEACQLENISFPLKEISKKWLFYSADYLRTQADPGPSRALHGALACLKNLARMSNPVWQEVLSRVPLQVGLIKATSDCGNTSVSMGLAIEFFKKSSGNAVALLNFGTGGVRFQLYVRSSEATGGIVSCLLEYKPPGRDKGVLSKMSMGSYQPTDKKDADEIKSEIEAGLRSAPWNDVRIMKETGGIVPVFAFVTGTLRNYWEEHAEEAELISDTVNQFLEKVLGQTSYYSQILNLDKFEFLIPQKLEGQMELVACRAMYAQYSAMTGQKLEPIISLGCGMGSSQWTSLEAGNDPDDFTQFSQEPVMKFGMDCSDLAERLSSCIVNHYQDKMESLARLVLEVEQRGNVPVIALKSGCLLPLDDFASNGKQNRKMLVELSPEVGTLVPVKICRKDQLVSTALETSLPLCLPVACAIATQRLSAHSAAATASSSGDSGEHKINVLDFVKVQVGGKFVEYLNEKNVKEGAVLVFWTAKEFKNFYKPSFILNQTASSASVFSSVATAASSLESQDTDQEMKEKNTSVVMHLGPAEHQQQQQRAWANFALQLAPSLRVPRPLSQASHCVSVGILGAGLSGLYAGILAKDVGLNVTVLEANERLGGRFFTKYLSSDKSMYAEMGANAFPRIKIMDRLINEDVSWSLISYLNRFFSMNEKNGSKKVEGESKQHKITLAPFIKSHPNNVKCFDGFTKPANDPFWNEKYCKQLIDGNGANESENSSLTNDVESVPNVAALLREEYEKVERDGQKLEHVSVRAFLERRFSSLVVDWLEMQDRVVCTYDQELCDYVLNMLDFTSSEQQITSPEWVCVEGGSSKLIEAMASAIGSDMIRKGSKVTKISPTQEARVQVNTSQEKMVFDHVISTIPPGAFRIVDTSSCGFSNAKKAALRALSSSQSTRIALTFQSRFWEQDENMVCKGGESVTDMSIGTVVYPSYDIGAAGAAALLIDSPSKEISLLSSEEQVEMCLRELELLYGPIVREQYVTQEGFFSHSWNQDPCVLGGSTLFSSKHFSGLVASALDHHLHFAGEATSVSHAWAVGALDSAYRSIAQILVREGLIIQLKELVERWGIVDDLQLSFA